MKSRLVKKLIAYGFLPFMVVLFSVSPLLGLNTAHAQVECELFSGHFNAGMCVGSVISVVIVMFNIILGLLLYLIGMILDFAIQFSIAPGVDDAGMGGLYRSETVNVAWNLLRDIINMSFIFILLYIAIGTVLNIQNVNWKKQVSQIIIAAILVNFSLFITRVVIDAGNIVAHSFYTQLTVCDPLCTDFEGNNPRPSVGISERFMGALGIPQIDSLKTLDDLPSTDRGWNGVANGLMKMVVILIAMWVFLSVAILFIARTFALVFILVLSPIGIAGSSLPILGKYAQQWREQLFKQSMLGVVFLFFTFVILTFAVTEREAVLNADIGIQGDNRDLIQSGLGSLDEETKTESLIIMYALVIAGLIMSLRLTKNMSGQIGKFADGVGKGIVGAGLGVATGGTAMALRRTAGAQAARELSSQKGKDLKEKADKGDLGAIQRYKSLQSRATSTYDVRTTKLGGIATKKASSALGGVAGLSATTGIKAGEGGRLGRIEKVAEKENERYKDLSPTALRNLSTTVKERAGKTPRWIPTRLVDEKRASELKKMADRKETSAEDRIKRAERASGVLSSKATDDETVRVKEKALGELRSQDLPLLTEEALTSEFVVSRLKSGDLEKIKGSVNRGVWDQVSTSEYLSDRAKAYLKNQEDEELGKKTGGKETSGREETDREKAARVLGWKK